MNVLVIEDDTLLGGGLLKAFERAGYTVALAVDGREALALVGIHDPDLIVLDLGLPDLDGLDVLRQLRRDRVRTPVLILTARDGVEQRVAALDAGADDYIEKPFDLRELEARVRALIRRAHTEFEREVQLGALTLDPFAHEVRIDGELIEIPSREYEVLEALVMNRNKTVSKARLAQRLTASNEDIGDNAVEVYVHRLRRRFSHIGLSIRTVRGVGYLIENPLPAGES